MSRNVLIALITLLISITSHASGASAPAKLKEFKASEGSYSLQADSSGNCPQTTTLDVNVDLQIINFTAFNRIDFADWQSDEARMSFSGDKMVFEEYSLPCSMCSTLEVLEGEIKEEWIQVEAVTIANGTLRIEGDSLDCIYKKNSK